MEEGKKRRFSLKMGIKTWLVLVIVIASLGSAGYFWNDAREAKQQTPDAVAARNQEETSRVVSELSSILFTEGDQEPTVARVEDPTVLQKSNPDFYKNTQAGDYLVLYPQRAIIYRSENKQIINIAPIINTNQLNQQQADTGTPTENSATQDITTEDTNN